MVKVYDWRSDKLVECDRNPIRRIRCANCRELILGDARQARIKGRGTVLVCPPCEALLT